MYQSTTEAFEVFCPSFPELSLAEQIKHGVNDWAVEGNSGHLYYGKTPAEALEIATIYLFH
jgi:hypothetical protein